MQLLAGTRPVPIGGPSVRGLLAMLVLNANKVVALDDIIDALWGDDPPATARTIVHGNVSHLRRVLRSIQPHGADEVRIRTAAPGYQLTVDQDRIDAAKVRALLERAERKPLAARAELLAEAFALWRGPVLGGVPGSLHAPELEELRLAVHGARVDAELALGRHAELISELAAMVRENPLAERTVGQLMRALYYSGRRAEALSVYRRVSRNVVETMGIDPGPELAELHERVLNDDLPPADGQRSEPPAALSVAAVAPAQLPPTVPSLSGRLTELGWLDDLLLRATRGLGGIGVITGIAGVGKSTLLVSWAHRVAGRFEDGVLFAALRGADPNHPPAEPSDVLTQFLLGLGVPLGELPDQLDERLALYRSLLAERKVLVLLDDARSAEQVRPLLPTGKRSMAVITSRSRLDGLVVSNAARVCALDTLSPAEAVRLIDDEDAEQSRVELHRLARLCGYLPLALRIAGARLAASPQWTIEDLNAELADERTRLAALDVDGADTSVRAALDVSWRGLPEDVADTARRLGVLTGDTVGPPLVAAACGIPLADARRRLRVLAGHNLLAERARDVFAQHDLVRLYLRELAERELTAVEREQVLARSVRYYQVSADLARRRLLRIVDPLDFTRASGVAGLAGPEGTEQALDWFVTEWPNLMATLEAARAAGRHEDVWRLARVMHTYRVVRPLWDDWTRLVEIGMTAAVAAGSELGRCWMLISRCAVALTFERVEGSLADAEAALRLAERLGQDRLMISATIHFGCALSLSGRYAEAIERLRQAIAETERTGDLALCGQALNNCAEAEKRAGRFAEAIEHSLSSLHIDRKLGDDSYVVVSLNNLAELHLRIGELEAAERFSRESIELTVSREFTLQEAVSRLTLGRTLRAQGRHAEAREQLERSLELHRRINPGQVPELHTELAGLSAEGG
nr:BTAD domain-containing putative transcriptional regulator [Amycolatopsis nigrescens]